MSKSAKRSDSLKRKHWSIKAHESLITRNAEGHFCLNIEGGAENGLLPFIGEIRQDKIRYQSGRLHHGEIVLEVNGKKVAGMIKKDVIALIKRSADPVSLVTAKQNATITKDIRQYLSSRFTKNSVDSELQHQIRENLHMRVVPCTTRSPQDGERQGIDYNFISVDEFKHKEKAGQLLESGIYENNYYGTPKPPADPPSNTNFPAYSRSPASTGYSKEALLAANSLSPPSLVGRGGGVPYVPKSLGPLPGNWEIAYTENNEKYFIDHSTGTTHWLDPRLAHYLKLNVLECTEQELPYGWEKVNDPIYGVYFIDHINRTTQYENPVTEAKRRYAGSQLPQRGMGYDDRAPPPLREPPPTVQSAAALEKQREAEAAAMWPEAGLRDYADNYPYPYPNSHPSEQDLEAELEGEILHISLAKTPSGFGFTIIGGDRAGELLQIKSIVQGGVADRDGRLCVGDVLVRINGISVLTYNHRKVVDLFQSLPLNSEVELEVRRGYPLPEFRVDELPSYNESNRGYGDGYNQPELTKVTAYIVKGPLGFGFSLGESPLGPVVKQIMDVPRCAQLREGDVLAEVNGENVQSYVHTDLVTVLKRCSKGNQAAFLVLRTPDDYPQYYNDGYQQELPPYGGSAPDGIAPPPAGFGDEEPFNSLEVRLIRQVSGFGFRIIGGREEGSQATVGAIVAGGAADLDGRLQIGDEITHINGRWVQDASHRDVISLMGEAAASGEVVLGIRRKMPMPETMSAGPIPSYPPTQDEQMPSPPKGVREVTVDRPTVQTSFGFVLQSNTLRSGCMICRLIPDSPADQSGLLYVYDELLAVNGQDVSRMDHGDIVNLIKSSSTQIHLAVMQPEDLERFERQMLSEQQQSPSHQTAQTAPQLSPSHQTAQQMSPSHETAQQMSPSHETAQQMSPSHQTAQQMSPSRQTAPAGFIPQAQQQDNRRQYQDYPNAGEEEQHPQISADLSDIASDDEEIYHIDIKRDGGGFGFSIRGGAEYSSALCVLRIAEGGAAEKHGQLKVGDELLEINGNSTEGMLHSDAITIIKHGGDIVKLIVRRVPDEHFVGGQRSEGGEILSPIVSPSAKDRYTQAYMSSLEHRGSRGNSEEPHPANQ